MESYPLEESNGYSFHYGIWEKARYLTELFTNRQERINRTDTALSLSE